MQSNSKSSCWIVGILISGIAVFFLYRLVTGNFGACLRIVQILAASIPVILFSASTKVVDYLIAFDKDHRQYPSTKVRTIAFLGTSLIPIMLVLTFCLLEFDRGNPLLFASYFFLLFLVSLYLSFCFFIFLHGYKSLFRNHFDAKEFL